MSCDKCDGYGKNKDINIKFKIDGEEHSASWSEMQAKEFGFHSVFENADFPLGDIIASVLKKDLAGNLPAKLDSKSNPKCPNCGLTFFELLEVGRIGCAHCYAAFGDQMEILLEKIHGSAMHVGFIHEREGRPMAEKKAVSKPKARPKKKISKEEKLRTELKRAIDVEDYENAARLRDILQTMAETK